MNSLLNYGSDDECDVSSEEKPMDSYASSRNHRRSGTAKQDDANYDEVQMSLSEDSSDDAKPAREQSRRHSRDREDRYREESRRWNDSPKPRDDYRPRKDRGEDRYASKTEKEDRHASKTEKEDRYASKTEKEDRYASKTEKEDRYASKTEKEDRYASKTEREDRSRHRDGSREDERTRERYRGEKDEERPRERREDRGGKAKERYTRDDRYRDRKDRDRRRSRSPRDRERRRSRSPRKTERSRSRSKDRGGRGGYSKRFDRANTKMERLDKMDLQKSMGEEKNDSKDRFFVPGITGRFREQIEKRKLLWQKKEPEVKPQVAPAPVPGGSRTTKVWEATTFAQDTDGKVANKFKRLMGIKSMGEGSNAATDVLKKQEEMFSSMEQQYEVARTATHTMRGVGLGFGSYQR